MVAVVPPLLSDRPPEIPQKAGFGDRFHYFRGRSGRRYLFTVVSGEEFRDFRSVVAMLAAAMPSGRLAADAIVTVDALGRVEPATDPAWPPAADGQTLCLVHLLAASEAERRAVLADLAPPAMRIAA